MKVLKPFSLYHDPRGIFHNLLSGTVKTFADLNLTETVKGGTRGGHYHTRTSELFIILSGRLRLTVETVARNRIARKETFHFKKYDMFLIEPYEQHTIRTLTRTVWLTLLTRQFREDDKDFRFLHS